MKANLLIVDDEETIAESLSRHFRFLGYDVETVVNGAEALESLAKRRTEVVISDIMMPVMDGIDMLRQVKRQYPMTHVIMMTGYVSLDNALACMRLGADTCIFKPFETFDEIEDAVDKAMSSLRMWQDKLKQLRAMEPQKA